MKKLLAAALAAAFSLTVVAPLSAAPVQLPQSHSQATEIQAGPTTTKSATNKKAPKKKQASKKSGQKKQASKKSAKKAQRA